MKVYRILGTFLMGEYYQSFTKEILAKGKSDAVERLYSDFGSKHNVKRRYIKIEKISEIKADKIEDPIIKFQVGKKND